MPQNVRDAVGTRLLQLTLRELFDWRYMQTDPNWGNFLYDASSDTLHLIDFGAAKAFSKAFVDSYLQMVHACAERNKAGVIEMSTKLGFLTGVWCVAVFIWCLGTQLVIVPCCTRGLFKEQQCSVC